MEKEDGVFFVAGVCITKESRGYGRMFSVCAPFFTISFSGIYLEDTNILDIDNEIHLFSLHYVFLPRLNQSLHEFIHMWNNHPLGTERNMSPAQLWMTGEHPAETELTEQVCNFNPLYMLACI